MGEIPILDVKCRSLMVNMAILMLKIDNFAEQLQPVFPDTARVEATLLIVD
jgi:hypothetical protein